MDKSYRKTQKFLMTQVHDRRTTNFWPSEDKTLSLLTY